MGCIGFAGGLGPEEKSRGKAVFVWGGVRALERLTLQVSFRVLSFCSSGKLVSSLLSLFV